MPFKAYSKVRLVLKRSDRSYVRSTGVPKCEAMYLPSRYRNKIGTPQRHRREKMDGDTFFCVL